MCATSVRFFCCCPSAWPVHSACISVVALRFGSPIMADVRLAVQGPRMVRDVFRLAKQNSPSIIFVDEVRALAVGAAGLWVLWAAGRSMDQGRARIREEAPGQSIWAGGGLWCAPPTFSCLPCLPNVAQVDAIATARFDAQTGADRCAGGGRGPEGCWP